MNKNTRNSSSFSFLAVFLMAFLCNLFSASPAEAQPGGLGALDVDKDDLVEPVDYGAIEEAVGGEGEGEGEGEGDDDSEGFAGSILSWLRSLGTGWQIIIVLLLGLGGYLLVRSWRSGQIQAGVRSQFSHARQQGMSLTIVGLVFAILFCSYATITGEYEVNGMWSFWTAIWATLFALAILWPGSGTEEKFEKAVGGINVTFAGLSIIFLIIAQLSDSLLGQWAVENAPTAIFLNLACGLLALGFSKVHSMLFKVPVGFAMIAWLCWIAFNGPAAG